jgi:hypothetical protein
MKIASGSCSLPPLKLRRVLVRREHDEQFGETDFVRVAQGRVSVGVDPLRMLPSQGFTNLHAKFGVGGDLIAHGCNTLNGWLSSGGCFDVDFWGSLRKRGWRPVLSVGQDDV